MILTRTPLRISFVGGGSDLPAFCDFDSGAVVSMAINRFVYVGVNRKFDDRVRVSYAVTEDVAHGSDLQHDLVRNSLKYFGEQSGIEITSMADIPGKGTGLGSSSSFTTGLINALNSYQSGNEMTRIELAKLAAYIEIELCGKPIGKQDHYAAAFGGLNLIHFDVNGSVKVEPIRIDLNTLISLSSRLMLFYTGRTRASKGILEDQQSGLFLSDAKREATVRMVQLAHTMAEDLNNSRLDSFGDYLELNWELKKGLSDKISDSEIDTWVEAGLSYGAAGAKVCGAGGGGFLLFYALEDKQPKVRETMAKLGLKEMPFMAHMKGSEVLYVG